MSKTLFIGLLTAAQLAALHDAGHVVDAFKLSEPQKIVAVLKSTSIGATVAADIAAVNDQSIGGAQKFATVLANTTPLVLRYMAGGPHAIVADAEDIARELVQSIYNDTIGAAKAAAAAAAVPVEAPVQTA